MWITDFSSFMRYKSRKSVTLAKFMCHNRNAYQSWMTFIFILIACWDFYGFRRVPDSSRKSNIWTFIAPFESIAHCSTLTFSNLINPFGVWLQCGSDGKPMYLLFGLRSQKEKIKTSVAVSSIQFNQFFQINFSAHSECEAISNILHLLSCHRLNHHKFNTKCSFTSEYRACDSLSVSCIICWKCCIQEIKKRLCSIDCRGRADCYIELFDNHQLCTAIRFIDTN